MTNGQANRFLIPLPPSILLVVSLVQLFSCILPTFGFSQERTQQRRQQFIVHLPENWKDENNHNSGGWSKEAAIILKNQGMVALAGGDDMTLIEETICDNAQHASLTRLQEMHRRIESRGLDPTGLQEPYRFSEIICRDEGGKRYDIPVEWLGSSTASEKKKKGTGSSIIMNTNVGSGRIGTPLQQKEADAISEFHKSVNRIIKPVLNSMWSSDTESDDGPENNNDSDNASHYVAAAGFLVNEPGSESQNWHRDGPDEGYIDCFVPLIDLNHSIGPTALQPGTHTTGTQQQQDMDDNNNDDVLVPLLKKGEVLLFDYRTLHRGQGNKSQSTTRTLAYAVYRRKEGEVMVSGDIHNFPAALTLEYD